MAYPIHVEPECNESINGFIHRVAQANLMSTREIANHLRFSTNTLTQLDGSALERLSEATVVPPTALTKMQLSQETATLYRVGDCTFPKRLLNLGSSRFCPECLAIDGYHRLHWQILSVTHCPAHGVPLRSTCPACRNDLAWNRRELSSCKCGHDLRVVSGDSQRLDAAHLSGVRLLCERSGYEPTWQPISPSISSKVWARPAADLDQILRLLGQLRTFDIGSEEFTCTSPWDVVAADGLPFLSHGLALATSWPAALHAHMDSRTDWADGIPMRRPLIRWLKLRCRALPPRANTFVADEISRWSGMQVPPVGVELVASHTNRRLSRNAALLNRKEAGAILGIVGRQVLDLSEAPCSITSFKVNRVGRTRSRHKYYYRDDLLRLNALVRTCHQLQLSTSGDSLGWSPATTLLSSMGIGVAKTLDAVLTGRLKPISVVGTIGDLRFDRTHLHAFLERELADQLSPRVTNRHSHGTSAKALGISEQALHRAQHLNLLKPITIKGYKYFEDAEIRSFSDRYVTRAVVAHELDLDPRVLKRLLKKNSIEPIGGMHGRYSKHGIYLRSDIVRLGGIVRPYTADKNDMARTPAIPTASLG